MSGSFRVESLTSSEFLKEIHYLFWRAPFNNKGAHDCGWGCRDHAAIVTLLLRNFNIPSFLCSGRMALVTGPNGGPRSYGYTVDVHSWTFVEGIGWLDISIRVPRQIAPWGKWKIEGLIGTSIQANLPTLFSVVKSSAEFENDLEAAKCVPGGRAAIYHIQGHQPGHTLSIDNLTRWVDSPHSRRVAAEFPSDPIIYLKAAYHLYMLIEGRRETLTSLPKAEVWKHISQISDEAVLSSMPRVLRPTAAAGLRTPR